MVVWDDHVPVYFLAPTLPSYPYTAHILDPDPAGRIEPLTLDWVLSVESMFPLYTKEVMLSVALLLNAERSYLEGPVWVSFEDMTHKYPEVSFEMKAFFKPAEF